MVVDPSLVLNLIISTAGKEAEIVSSDTIIQALIGLIKNMFGMVGDVWHIFDPFSAYLPSPWMNLFLALLGLTLALRIWSFVSSMSFFGFKLPGFK